MRAIRGRDTKPELAVRSIAHKLGYRFVLHQQSLPGRPDIVFTRRLKVIFVHGCFWHRHKDCRYAYVPKTRTAWWEAKFEANQVRDARALAAIKALGWDVLVVWECECDDPGRIAESLKRFLGRRRWARRR